MSLIDKDLTYLDVPEPPTVATLRKNIMRELVKNYPQHSVWATSRSAWLIDINYPGGVVTISNLWLSGKMGYTMKLTDDHETLVKKIVHNAGELFERYDIAREKGLDMREKFLNIPRTFTGEAIATGM